MGGRKEMGSDGIVLDLHCGAYTNRHEIKCTHSTNVNFLVLTLYYWYVRCDYWGSLAEECTVTSLLSLQLPMTLLLLQTKKFFKSCFIHI